MPYVNAIRQHEQNIIDKQMLGQIFFPAGNRPNLRLQISTCAPWDLSHSAQPRAKVHPCSSSLAFVYNTCYS